jgi:mono/diheme cytochrome c family protein
MKTALKIAASLVVVIILALLAGYSWASSATGRILASHYTVHMADFPIPFPLSEAEVAEQGLTAEAVRQLAQERAIERGRHLISARYPCADCHGENFGGGVMVDAFPIGTLLGPNLTAGMGSRTLSYTAADWDRIVRHGVLPDGRPATMPAEDFRLMSDQELSDIIVYIRSLPPVNNAVPAPKLGPLGKILVATGQIRLSANVIGSHDSAHRVYPPEPEPTLEFGEHLAATCTGCHRANFAGGKIAGGDPSWAPAANLTPGASGLGPWSEADFVKAMREGIRPDGRELVPPMTFLLPYTQKMTDVELRAIWLYLRSVPAAVTGS